MGIGKEDYITVNFTHNILLTVKFLGIMNINSIPTNLNKQENIMQDKTPRNKKGQAHGYWEVYHSNGNLWYKLPFLNDNAHGNYIYYSSEGSLVLNCYMLYGQNYGFSEHLNKRTYYAR